MWELRGLVGECCVPIILQTSTLWVRDNVGGSTPPINCPGTPHLGSTTCEGRVPLIIRRLSPGVRIVAFEKYPPILPNNSRALCATNYVGDMLSLRQCQSLSVSHESGTSLAHRNFPNHPCTGSQRSSLNGHFVPLISKWQRSSDWRCFCVCTCRI
jgi:hypothetical protein